MLLARYLQYYETKIVKEERSTAIEIGYQLRCYIYKYDAVVTDNMPTIDGIKFTGLMQFLVHGGAIATGLGNNQTLKNREELIKNEN